MDKKRKLNIIGILIGLISLFVLIAFFIKSYPIIYEGIAIFLMGILLSLTRLRKLFLILLIIFILVIFLDPILYKIGWNAPGTLLISFILNGLVIAIFLGSYYFTNYLVKMRLIKNVFISEN